MAVQLSLFGDMLSLPASSSAKPKPRREIANSSSLKAQRGDHNLFFGAVPPPRLRDEVAARWSVLSDQLGLTQQLRRSTLHMSVYGLGFMRSLDMRFVDAFREVADQVAFSPFDLVFTRTANFGGNAFVLTTDDNYCQPLQDLAEKLRSGLSEIGIRTPHRLPTIRPHITLAYTSKLPEQPVEPLKWTVNSFTLIDSLYGYGEHRPLGHWPQGH